MYNSMVGLTSLFFDCVLLVWGMHWFVILLDGHSSWIVANVLCTHLICDVWLVFVLFLC